MPRQARIDSPGALHHGMCRGIERRNIFWDTQNSRDFVERLSRVAEIVDVTAGEILEPIKKPERVRARSLVCYWAVTELGLAGTTVGKRLGLIQSAVSKAVERDANVASQHAFSIED